MEKQLMIPIELLAPAKDLESGLAALSCGADALYIGATKFGARKASGNSLADIETLVKKAHILGSKVYVTLNTILTDKELVEAQTLIYRLYKIGVDALIIQDMGLLEIELPPIALFASTQTDNTSFQKIQFLEDVGFKRVVLARELSLEEIKNIRAQTSIELETFVHGSICISYSGRCYLSLALGGKSANRGVCAQPCRKKYTLKDGSHVLKKDSHLLSPKDLNFSMHLEKLLLAGVTSFKIEGRLKNLLYVKNTVSYYRKALDKIFEEGNYKKNSSGKVHIPFEPDLDKSYHRGYTDYFLLEKNTFKNKYMNTFSQESPKPIGTLIGKVVNISNQWIEIAPTESGTPNDKIANGDGFAFFNNHKELIGMRVDRIEGKKIFTKNTHLLTIGTPIYRNHDHLFVQKVLKAKTERKIEISFHLFEKVNTLFLEVLDEDGITAEIEIKSNENFQDLALAKKIYQDQLAKVGDLFHLRAVSFDVTYFPYLSIKDLNAKRRDLLEILLQKREKHFHPIDHHRREKKVSLKEKTLSFEANILNQSAEAFYEKHGIEDCEKALESSLDFAEKKVMTMKSCIFCQIGKCSPGKKLSLIDSHGKEHLIQCNAEKCQVEIFIKASS